MHQKVLIRTKLVLAERIPRVDVGIVPLVQHLGRREVVLLIHVSIVVILLFIDRPVGIVIVRLLVNAS